LLKRALEAVELACELVVGLCIGAGLIEAAGRIAAGGFRSFQAMRTVWLRFAAWMLLSLEFALAADIVGTAVAPSWEAIGQLASIATIRTALNFFLERDLKEARAAEGRVNGAVEDSRRGELSEPGQAP
jgi:uncharacterized membrane protein